MQWLAAESFLCALGRPESFHVGVFLASAAFALAVGVLTQLMWQEKAVTTPPRVAGREVLPGISLRQCGLHSFRASRG